MNKQIILRVHSPEGQYRITMMTRDTYGELLLKLSKKLNYLIKDIVVMREDGKLFTVGDGVKIGDINYFADGAILKVDTKGVKKPTQVVQVEKSTLTAKCNHPQGGKCLNCVIMSKQPPKDTNMKQKVKQERPRCNHGPGGKCLNCTQVDMKDKKTQAKMLCQHGPNAKCLHCLDQQFISDAAHISFDNWLQNRKLKCKGVHPSQVRCNNCLPPQKIQYQVDKYCKMHQPYPKAMCNKCIPPSVLIKRQEYRHVDYVQFMNISAIQDFIKYWLPRKHQEQRVGYLYGYYAEDPSYKGGIRVIVEALYQPKQKGNYSGFEIVETEQETGHVDMLANGLTLERVGWIYTQTNNDVVMSDKQVRMAARFQEKFGVQHQNGYQISNFITVILRTDQKNPNQVKPEVYMISDQGQALERSDLFVEANSRRKMKVRVKEQINDAYPTFVCGGKNATEFEPQFLLVKIAHGSPKNNKFAILKKADFPPIIRDKPSKKDFKEYMKRNKNVKQSCLKYGDFNFLLYLVHQFDMQTVLNLAENVANETQIEEVIDELIQHKADL